MGQAFWHDCILLLLRHDALGCSDLEGAGSTTLELGARSHRGWRQNHQLGPVVGYIA